MGWYGTVLGTEFIVNSRMRTIKMEKFKVSDFFTVTETETEFGRTLQFSPCRVVSITLKDGQSKDSVLEDANYPLQVIQSFVRELKDAQSLILKGDRNAIRNEKRAKAWAQLEEIDALKAEIESLKK